MFVVKLIIMKLFKIFCIAYKWFFITMLLSTPLILILIKLYEKNI